MSQNQLGNSPTNLLFLHGFLGCPDDWTPLLSYFQEDYCIQTPPLSSIPLPNEPTILIGYSMGGRIALILAEKHPHLFKRVIAISAHPGLAQLHEKKRRLKKDLILAEALEKEPLSQFLNRWYNQPIFSSLRKKRAVFDAMLKRRQKIDTSLFAKLLREYSLGKQTLSQETLKRSYYLYGEEDEKYRAFSSAFSKSFSVPLAGHAPHLENPQKTAEAISLALK